MPLLMTIIIILADDDSDNVDDKDAKREYIFWMINYLLREWEKIWGNWE